jgi:hypothetical protein
MGFHRMYHCLSVAGVFANVALLNEWRRLTTHSTRPAPACLSYSLCGFLGLVLIRGAGRLIRALGCFAAWLYDGKRRDRHGRSAFSITKFISQVGNSRNIPAVERRKRDALFNPAQPNNSLGRSGCSVSFKCEAGAMVAILSARSIRALGVYCYRKSVVIVKQERTMMNYIVRVEENSHYMDESERYTLGEFTDAEVAISAAKRLVDEDLNSLYRAGMTAEQLYQQYTSFGHDAYIISGNESCQFSARDYAGERCREICSRASEVERHT